MELLTEIKKNYSIRLAKHKLQFCRVYPISELDEIILGLLNLNDGLMDFTELGLLLGFAVCDLPARNIHYDEAEVSIIEGLLETLQRYHLINVDQRDSQARKVQITKWGNEALINKEKRLFFEGTITLPEHYKIEITLYQNARFPFKKYGINSIITNSSECDPFEINESTDEDDPYMILAKNNMDNPPNQNARIELSKIDPEVIGYSEKVLSVAVSLYELNNSYKITSAINGLISPELHELINPSRNSEIYNDWLKTARYHNYLQSSMQLTSQGLEEFSFVIDWPKVLNDDRIIWNSELLELLENKDVASSRIWTIVSENAPIDIVTSNISRFRSQWNWFRLTERIPFSFILEHANDLEWDFDALISQVGSDDVQQLLDVIEDNSMISDWSLVTERVSSEFLTENLRKYPWDLYLVTKTTDLITTQMVLNNLDLNWNWSFIAINWPLDIIAGNFKRLSDKFNLKVFLTRMFKKEEEVEFLLNSKDFLELLRQRIKNNDITFSTDDEIILNETTLDLLNTNNLLFWGEGNISGIEANPNIKWNVPLFKNYHHKILSEKGFTHVSSSLTSLKIIEAYPDFPWDYTVLSKRKDLNWNIEFIEAYKERLSPQNLLTHLSASIVLDNIQFFLNWLFGFEEIDILGDFISHSFSFSQILFTADKLTSHKIGIDWDSVLRSYSKEKLADVAIELDDRTVALPSSNDLFNYLTQNCSLEFILENPELSWNWKYLTENRLEQSQLSSEDFRFEYAEQLYWPYILKSIVTAGDLSKIDVLTHFAAAISKAPNEIIKESWQIITVSIRRHKLWELIPATENFEVFQWNWDLISSMENLAITHDFLNRYADKLNWNILSKNPYLNDFFRYDNAAFKHLGHWIDRCREYLYAFRNEWDFNALSHIENLTWNVTIISEFEEKWDWKVLSSTGNLLTFKHQKTGKIEFQPARLKKFSENLDWEILSRRHDVTITTNLLAQFARNGWDWSALSAHPKFEITHEFLKYHAEKPWDYKALTVHPQLKLNKDLLLELADKDWDLKKLSKKQWIDNNLILRFEDREWDWYLLSQNKSLIPDLNLLQVFDGKDGIEWQSIVRNPNLHITFDTVKILARQQFFNDACWNILSEHQKLDFGQQPELLYNFRISWNWQSLVEGQKFDFNELELLRKYENYLDWPHLSSQRQFKPTTDVLYHFKDKLDWRAITDKVELSRTLLVQFEDYLYWSYISKSDATNLTPELIEQFKQKWDYYELKENVTLSYESRSKVSEIIQDLPELEFYFKLKEQNSKWSGYIYHFTHIQNATKIIQSKKILSRNKAHDIADAAGTVVQRRDTSHDYARFYFRPQTPTQFYNECLGADIDLRNFAQAQKLGLPKCPIPVFFRFNIQEVLLTMRDKCYISNGNMQTNWAKENLISQMMSSFTFKDLYSTFFDTSDNDWMTYIRYSQQEFLVKDKFDFSKLRDVQIIVRSNEDRDQLIAFLAHDELAQKIIVDNPSLDIFHYGNKKIEYSFKDGILSVNTDYKGDGIHHGEIHLDFFSETHYDIINGHIKNIQDNRVVAYPDLTVKIPEPASFQLLFHDDRKDESWLIFTIQQKTSRKSNEAQTSNLSFTTSIDSFLQKFPSYSETYHTQVRHYTLYKHTQLVCKQFEKYFQPIFTEVDPDLFKFFLIVHDIGKPTAFKNGNKMHQHKFTVEELIRIWPETPFSSNDLELVKALASGDPIGEFMQGQREVDDVINYLIFYSNKASIPIEKLFKLFTIYYQCDTAAYTADAGGRKFLEHLFEYDGNMKKYDPQEGLLKFREPYRSKYEELKECILHGNSV